MPKTDDMVHFENYQKGLGAPLIIYADFEAINEKVHRCQPNNDKSYTESYQKHKDCGYGYKVVCCYDDEYTKPVQLLEEVEWCKKMKHKHFNKDMMLTEVDKRNFKNANKCYFSNRKYSAKGFHVRDHCHTTGKYRGSAHQYCNINYSLTDKILIIFHNLKGYDSHFIMQMISELAYKHTYKNTKGEEKQMDINVIQNNMEKYMAFML